MTDSHPPTLEYRRIQPAPLRRHSFNMRGVFVVLGLIGIVFMVNLIMLVLLFLG